MSAKRRLSSVVALAPVDGNVVPTTAKPPAAAARCVLLTQGAGSALAPTL